MYCIKSLIISLIERYYAKNIICNKSYSSWQHIPSSGNVTLTYNLKRLGTTGVFNVNEVVNVSIRSLIIDAALFDNGKSTRVEVFIFQQAWIVTKAIIITIENQTRDIDENLVVE